MKVIDGDFGRNQIAYVGKTMFGKPKYIKVTSWLFFTKKIRRDQIANVAIVTEQNKASLLRLGGWGAAGAILAGPLGAAAGMIVGGRHQVVTFIVATRDGRKMLVSGKTEEFQQVFAMASGYR